jgi:peptidoglycan/xylan/chitin deacetylase (PgdA/CDA1 family)
MAVRNRARHTVAGFSRFCGAVLVRRFPARAPRARILIYHSVSDDPANPFAVSPAAFRRQMAHLSSHCAVVPLSKLTAMIRDGRELPDRAVAVTFDDGYEDNYLNAFPVLKEFRIPATIFLVAGAIRDDADSGETDPGEIRFMSWGQAREMAGSGIAFGSHTLSHPSPALLPPEELTREFSESKRVMEQRLGEPVTGLAYPYGTYRDVDGRVTDAARQAGYSYACMAVNGTCGKGTDLFALPRTKIEYGDNHRLFEEALDGALDVFSILDQARRFFGKRRRPAG